MKQQRFRDGNFLPLLASLAIALNVVFITILVVLARPGETLDYWLERYQTLLSGAIAAAIGIVAAYLVLRQLKEMSRQNRAAEGSMDIARAQLAAAQRREIGHAIEALNQVRPQIFGLVKTLENRDYPEYLHVNHYHAWLPTFIPLLQTFKFCMDTLEPSAEAEAEAHYEVFLVCWNAASSYFLDANIRKSLDEQQDFYNIRQATTLGEAVNELASTIVVLNDLLSALRAMRISLKA